METVLSTRSNGDQKQAVIPGLHGIQPETQKTGKLGNYREMLPQAVAATLSGISLGDQFFDAAYRAAEQAGCELLFEIPSLFFRDPQGRAAAIRCGNVDEAELFFFVFNPENQSIRVVAGAEAPGGVLDFTRSYAGVLSLIRGDRKSETPLIQ